MSDPVSVADYELRRGAGDAALAAAVRARGLRPHGGAARRGAQDVLELLRDEVLRGLTLLGCTRPEDVGSAHVQRAVTYHSPG